MNQEEICETRHSKATLRSCTGRGTVISYLLHPLASQAICPDAFRYFEAPSPSMLRTHHETPKLEREEWR
jgi:hypothetical protein